MNVVLDVRELQPLLRELNLEVATAVTQLPGGSSPVFRIDLADGKRLNLKTYSYGLGAPRKEAYAISYLATLGLPVTQYLVLDGTRKWLPFCFAITSHLPGVSADTLKDHSKIADVYRQMGALLRKLHAVRMPGYGCMDDSGIVAPAHTNVDFLRRIIGDAFERFQHFGGDAALAERLRAVVAGRFDEIAMHTAGPVFAHNDLHPGNVLVTQTADGSLVLSGVIDFGNAHAADAVFDLAKALFCSMHQAPNCRAPMLEGYGAIDHPDPEGALWYYTLLHRMIMWAWLRQVEAIPAAETPSGLIDDLQEMANEAWRG
ncbi:MAG TPA: aminoglycoside phosphotransferase family protein [Devosiaceae bacterium]|jgi:Ser/Thr protein kinase RdoA (MazF antagonist)|nr:aminoglycoside phosphotransferase family protein [Devosiaceae bacterium]